MIRAFAALLAVVVSMSAFSPVARADDVFIRLNRSALQRFVSQLCPLTLSHALSRDVPVRLMIYFRNPVVIFQPGPEPFRGGKVFVRLDYSLESVPPIIQSLSGRINPSLSIRYDPSSRMLVLRIADFVLNLPNGTRIPLDQLLPPQRLPLYPIPPVKAGNRRVEVHVKDVRVGVTPDAVLVGVRLGFAGAYQNH